MAGKLLIFILFLLAMASSANGYWLENEPEPFSLREREHAPPSKEKIFFTIQDNFELFSDIVEHPPHLLPYSDYFIPADIIDANVPIFSLFSHSPLPAKDPLVNLLYANLRVKKLLEEYAEVQQRAKDLLGNERSRTTGKIDISGEANSEQINAEKITGNSHSLYKELSDLQNSLGAIRVTGDFPFTLHHETSVSSANPDNRAVSSQKKPMPHEISINPIASGPDISAQNTGKMNGAAGSPHKSPQGAQTQSDTSQNQNRDSYSGNLVIPWFMDLPSRIFNYFLSHPIETFFLALGILVLCNVIFGTRVH